MGELTAYTDFEARRIGQLPWYQDTQLIHVIVDFMRRNHARVLFDLCCGTGQLYPVLFRFYTTIHAVDLSPDMIENNRKNNPMFTEYIKYSCVDSATFVASHSDLIREDGDIPTIIHQIKDVPFHCCFVINTVNKSPKNFFDLLRAHQFKFTNRTKNYLTEELLDTYCRQIGHIQESACVRQQIPLTDWLKYHECDEQQISTFIKVLSSMTQSELRQYGLEFLSNNYMLQRFEKVYCIKHAEKTS